MSDAAATHRPARPARLRHRFKTQLGDDPRHRRRRQRAVRRDAPPRRPTARRSSGPRTASSARARTSASSSSTRPATPTQPARRTTAPAAGAASSSSRQKDPSADPGSISSSTRATRPTPASTTSTFLSQDQIAFVEDAGDTLHGQRNALDSGYVFDLRTDYSARAPAVRWLAEGRDASATLDAANGGFGKNEGDNEITGISSPTATRPERHPRRQGAAALRGTAGVGSTPSSTATTRPTR